MEPLSDERQGRPSASRMDRVMRCPGSWHAELGIERDAPSAAAVSGTKIHAVLEGSLPVSELSAEENITSDRIMAVEAELAEEYNLEDAIIHREVRLTRTNKEMQWLWSAKPDAIYVKKPYCYVVNYKTGWYEPITIDNNWQIVAECALAAEQFNCEYVVGILLHPNSGMGKQSKFFSRKELSIKARAIDQAVENALKEGMPRVPGLEQCTYCEARTKCGELQKQIAIQSTQIADITLLTPAQRGERLRLFKLAEAIIDKQRKQMHEMLESDSSTIEGWEILPGKTSRWIEYPPEQRDLFVKELERLGIKEYECSSLSIPKIEDAVYKKGGFTKQSAKSKVETELKPWIKTESQKSSLKEKRSSANALPSATP